MSCSVLESGRLHESPLYQQATSENYERSRNIGDDRQSLLLTITSQARTDDNSSITSNSL